MSVMELAAKLKMGEQSQVEKLESVKSELVSKIADIDALVVDHDAEVKAAKDAGFDEGVLSAGEVGKEGKIFSLDEMNAELAPRDTEIIKLKEANAKLAAELELLVAAPTVNVDVESAKAEAIAEFKKTLMAEYEAKEVVEMKAETGFAEFLK